MAILDDMIRITIFQRGPEDLPYSVRLLVTVFVVAGGFHWAVASTGPQQPGLQPWLTVIIAVGYKAVFIDGLLQLRGLGERRNKTLTAAFGTDALISVPALAVVSLISPDGARLTLTALLVTLSLWQLAVLTHILSRALDRRVGEATMWTLAYLLGTLVLFSVLAGS